MCCCWSITCSSLPDPRRPPHRSPQWQYLTYHLYAIHAGIPIHHGEVTATNIPTNLHHTPPSVTHKLYVANLDSSTLAQKAAYFGWSSRHRPGGADRQGPGLLWGPPNVTKCDTDPATRHSSVCLSDLFSLSGGRVRLAVLSPLSWDTTTRPHVSVC